MAGALCLRQQLFIDHIDIDQTNTKRNQEASEPDGGSFYYS